MTSTMREVEAAAMKLTMEERAELAGRLLLSLEEPSDSEIERLWLDEAERRLDEFRKGKAQSVSAEEVFRRALAEVS